MNEKKKYPDTSVLIFGAGGRQALAICRGFYQLGCKVVVYCAKKTDTGYLTRFSSTKILYNKNNQDSFFDYGLKLIKKGGFDLVVPLGDPAATYLSQHKKELEPYAKVAVNDWPVFQKSKGFPIRWLSSPERV